jgi:hypothetical protein
VAGEPRPKKSCLQRPLNATPASVKTWALVAAACVICSLLGAWLALAGRRLRASARGRAYNARGKQGERDAERILQAGGCRILDRQMRISYPIEVDRLTREVELVVDFLVEYEGEQMVAEVKTGRATPQLARPETRRQLLEYQLATGSRRVLLVDPDAESITEIAFPAISPSAHTTSFWRAIAITALLAAAALFWRLSN